MEESKNSASSNKTHNESDEPFKKPALDPPVFKKPTILIGKKGGVKIKSLSSSNDELVSKEVPSIPSSKSEEPTNRLPNQKDSTSQTKEAPKIPTSIPYSEPSWGGIPHARFFVEELKSGQIVNTIDLSSRSFYCVGRERNTHINLLHPTVSRYHGILQFRSTFDEKDPARGFYVYDLDSTHGTFLNRARIKPKMFVRVRVGHMLSFGSSTRFFILQGPSEDEEEESDLSVSELKEKRRLELERRQQEAEELKRMEEEKEEEEGGVDWGMGEDAEEECDLSENPFAVTNNEELYLEDPKKTLRGWFEREGEELTYDVDDIRPGEYSCRVSLPTEGMLGRNMTAEVKVKGKKKEAVAQGALEACRLLDRHGLLRQANHEARSKRRKKHDDEDDSDDDTFFDRTGAVEAKRAKKAAAHIGAVGAAPVETYDSLLVKHAQLVSLISSLESKLMTMTARAKRNVERQENGNEADPLEEFMKEGVVCDTMEDKIERRKLKVEIAALRKQEELARKLVNVAKPASLPELKPPLPELKPPLPELKPPLPELKPPLPELKPPLPELKPPPSTTASSVRMSRSPISSDRDTANVGIEEGMKTSEANQLSDQVESDVRQDKTQGKERRSIRPSSTLDFVQRKPSTTSSGNLKPTMSAADPSMEDFSNTCWQPPKNQTGDGRSALNDKYGY